MIRGVSTSIHATGPVPLETAPAPLEMRPPRVGLSLFWRTFFLLSLLLIGSIVAWLQTFRALEFEPRAVQTAQQIASLVNLSRAALVGSAMDRRIIDELVNRLGAGTVMGSAVNGEEGLWIGFKIDRDDYWMLLDKARFSQVGGKTWLVW